MTQAPDWVQVSQELGAVSKQPLPRRFYSQAHGEWQEDVPCPWCQGTKHSLVRLALDRVYHRPGSYPLVRCDDCDLLYVTPRPTFDSLAKHYPDDYFCYVAPEDAPNHMRIPMLEYNVDITRQRIELIEQCIGRIPRAASVLDVGCGLSDLLAMLERVRACEVRGVDFQESVVTKARLRGLNVDQGTLNDVGYQSGRFDIVSMIEYLEHESDPRAMLTEARRILKPGGHLVLEIPHPTAWPAKLFGNNWWNLHVPRHLVLFSPETLRRALTELGFESIHIRPFTLPYNMGSNLFLALGLRFSSKHYFRFVAATAVLGWPFLPFMRWMPEFIMATAQVPVSSA